MKIGRNIAFLLNMILFVTFFLSQLLSGELKTHENELAQIRAAIELKGADWTAEENEISMMDPDARRALLGLIPERPREDTPFAEGDPLAVFPSSLDWTDYNGYNWVTPVKDQLDCGSCVAFGSLGGLEARLNIFMNDWMWDHDLSEQHLFSCGGGSCWWGWTVSSSMNYLKNNGVPEEDCFEYRSYDTPCGESCDDWRNHRMQIRDWGWVSNNQNAIKTFLQDGPITTCMNVYTDFFYYSSGVYEHTWGSYEGGHCITFVGWDDDENSWKCKNSWGWGWGESGYFRIRYGDSGIGNSTAYVEVYPLIKIYCDKDTYTRGEDHVLGVKVVNPGSSYAAKVKIWIRFPNGTDHTVYQGVHTIPAGVSFSKDDFMAFTVPAQVAGGQYSWYGVITNSAGTSTKSFDKCSFQITP